MAEKNKTPVAPPPGRELLSRAEAAWVLGVGMTVLDQLISRRVIRVRRLPGTRRTVVSRKWLEKWIADGMPER